MGRGHRGRRRRRWRRRRNGQASARGRRGRRRGRERDPGARRRRRRNGQASARRCPRAGRHRGRQRLPLGLPWRGRGRAGRSRDVSRHRRRDRSLRGCDGQQVHRLQRHGLVAARRRRAQRRGGLLQVQRAELLGRVRALGRRHAEQRLLHHRAPACARRRGLRVGESAFRHQGLEGAAHLLRAERTLARILREELAEQRGDRTGHAQVRRDRAQLRRRRAALRLEHLLGRAREERLTTEHLEEDRTERVEVAAEADELAGSVLGGDVGRLAGDLEDRRARDARRDPGVDQADEGHAVAADDDVPRREVTLQQPRAVQLVEPRGDLRGDRDRLRRRQWPAGDPRGERLALDLLAEDPRQILRDSGGQRRREVRVAERRLLLELAREASALGRRPRRRLRDDLEDPGPTRGRLGRLVEDAGASCPELGTDLESRGERGGDGRHGGA